MADGQEQTERESSRGDFDRKLDWVLRCATTDLGLALREALRSMDPRTLRERVLALRDAGVEDPAQDEMAQVLVCIAVESLAAPNEDPEATVERCLNPAWLRAAGVCMQSVSVRPGAPVTSAQRALTSDLVVEDMGGGGPYHVWDSFATVVRASHLGWVHTDNPLRTRYVSESEIGLLRSVPGADVGDGEGTLDAREALRVRIDAAMAVLSGDELDLPSVEDEPRRGRGSGLMSRVNLLGSTVATPWSHAEEAAELEAEFGGGRRIALWGGGAAVAALVVLAAWLGWRALNPPANAPAGGRDVPGGSATMAATTPRETQVRKAERDPAAAVEGAGGLAASETPGSLAAEAPTDDPGLVRPGESGEGVVAAAPAPSGEVVGDPAAGEAGAPPAGVAAEAVVAGAVESPEASGEGAAGAASAPQAAEAVPGGEGEGVAHDSAQPEVVAPPSPTPDEAAEPVAPGLPATPEEQAVAAQGAAEPQRVEAAPENTEGKDAPQAEAIVAEVPPERPTPQVVEGFKPTLQLSRLAKVYAGDNGLAIKIREWPGGKALIGRCAVQGVPLSQATFRIYQGYRPGRLLCTGDLGPFCEALGCPAGQQVCDVGMAWLQGCDH